MLKQINDGIINTKQIVKISFRDDKTLVISDTNHQEMHINFKIPINDRLYFIDLLNFQLQDKRVQIIDLQSILDELEDAKEYEDSDNIDDFKW